MDSLFLMSIIGSAVGGAVLTGLVMKKKQATTALPAAPQFAAGEQSHEIVSLGSSSLVIQNSAGANALSVTQLPYALFDQVDAQEQKIPNKKLSRLNALFQGAPTAARAAQGVPENVWEVAINGPLLRALDANGNPIPDTFRAMTHGANGKFKENALLTKPGAVDGVMAATAAWQIASVVVAQKHLADISQRLGGIETGLERVEGKMDANRRGKLKGAIDYLKEISESILAGDFAPHFRIKLEDHAHQMMEAKHQVMDVLKSRIAALLSIQDPDTINADGYANLIRAEMIEIVGLFREALLCSRARFQAWSLLAVMPGNETLKPKRYENIRDDLNKLMDPNLVMGDFSKKIHTMITRIHARLWTAEALSKLRMDVSDEFEVLKSDLWSEFEMERKLVEQGAELLKDTEQPTRILVQTKGDEVISLKHLPANEMPQIAHQDLLPSVFSQQTIQATRWSELPLR